MDFLIRIERTVYNWFKNVPHLPTPVRNWLGENVWWIVLVGAILSGSAVLVAFFGLIALMSVIGTAAASYYVSSTITTWAIVTSLVALVFTALGTVLLALAISPLKAKQKKGWVLLFMAWLLNAVSIVVSAILSLDPSDFILSIIIGALFMAVSGYFLFEIHSQFAHSEKSAGAKARR